LNPTAPAYGSASRFGQNGNTRADNTANGEEGERVQNVLRHLGPSFWVREMIQK
jgi:hypothetical protein